MRELLEKIGKEIHDYERMHFGVRFGSDFPQIAEALIATEHFAMTEFLIVTIGLISATDTLKQLEQRADKTNPVSAIRDSMRGTPVENLLLEIFYWGYRAGRNGSEVAELERMHRSE